MKKIIEQVVTEDINIVERVCQLAEKDEAWIFISNGLLERLKRDYHYHDYPSKKIFCVDEQNERHLFVDEDYEWNKVALLPKGIYISSNPDIIYFLS